ncbi:Phage integrase [Moraxella catarrhalis]|uniref:Phage integrase n=1 Tax=Moraxella catarrhalis TaxID=480 RepID=A0A198UJJ0_MORCA|nr:Phage integrase [Moraxella catarrhalis]OAU96898.1 Phage integrase [Moraxella catarrhalis]OAV03284.1 Phage integrase [Moraxella catarrhalis]
MSDTPANRKTSAKIIEKTEAEITLNVFDYGAYFPKSTKVEQMRQLDDQVEACVSNKPIFGEFAKIWFSEKQIEWRPAYQEKMRIILDNYLLPYFGQKPLHVIKNQTRLICVALSPKFAIVKINKQACR